MEALYYLLGIVNIICLVIVAFNIAKQSGLLLALFLGLCCQIGAFIWGWLFWKENRSTLVMGIWTLSILLQIVIAVTHPELLPER